MEISACRGTHYVDAFKFNAPEDPRCNWTGRPRSDDMEPVKWVSFAYDS